MLAWALGDFLESAAIGAVLVINVTIGFWTEWRARVAVESLRKLQVDRAVVRRDGQAVVVDAATVVPGDVLMLGEGDAIAADARLLEANELRLNEASLTGESLPVAKVVEPSAVVDPSRVSVGDRKCMVYKGTMVAGGSGLAAVTATGRETEIGWIGELVGSLTHGPTPIERRLSVLGRRLVWITLGMAGLVIGVGLLGDRDAWLVVETGLALAIAAVPEGLPVVATVTLAVGMWRMARRNALVRRPPAVEALGSATVVCADKTGTLTTGQMTATTLLVGETRVEVSGAGLDPVGVLTASDGSVGSSDVLGLDGLLETAVLANAASLHLGAEGWTAVGDPTDTALLVLGAKVGLHREELLRVAPQVAQLPFSSWRMLMASFHGLDGDPVGVSAKGAAGRVLELCTHWSGPAGRVPLTDEKREWITSTEEAFADEGLRVLGLARGECDSQLAGSEDALSGLTFVGLIGLMDPPAPGVRETIARLRGAGVRTIMITGDQPATARNVALKLGMIEGGEQILSGAELSSMSEDELTEFAGKTTVFGRVSPEDKVRIVQALQARGEVVGMLGDGVNDAPALKQADIGVAMGSRGTDVAKDVADLVLADDRLDTVGVAVEEGRVIFDNIRKFIFYLFSCNVSEVGIVFVASLAALPLPLLPLQLLWLNVVTDVFPALALSVEPGEPDVMSRPPRPQRATILSRAFLTHLMVYASLITVATLGVFLWGLRYRDHGIEHAVTLAFMTLALAQLLHVFNARSFRPIGLHREFLTNRWLWAALILSGSLQCAAVYHPGLAAVLDTRPLAAVDWMVLIPAAMMPLLLGQIWKRVLLRRARGGVPQGA